MSWLAMITTLSVPTAAKGESDRFLMVGLGTDRSWLRTR
jgi:hypothetical protein